MNSDASSAVNMLSGKYKFDIIFMDPPYNKGLEKDVLYQISKSEILKDDSIIIVEASLETDFDYLGDYGLEAYKFKKYKTNMHVFIRKV